ncbi:retinitis pigmentosa GTPase regulator b isoform X1 [Takifugu rubripes]|uniref:retinitis pigmentosa GTPase regulator b isoform X1 n=1 Tax=Takifugu rubripes TaxID=31033 RepID=UPI0005D2328E|nr:X-linked retinitis pigmentosa GTPase regulator isoform X1 [Takifugu rubripes]|eukprot:XP_011604656.1 PREDICTED: X-linked retinitis pigmentosa GTPase regulator isoform X1 [Takifugu rubripes]
MAGEAEDEIPETGAVFTFGKSKFADNIPSKFWLKNDVPLKIACGDEHTALITKNGRLFMFGSNNWGQLGLGSKRTVNKPTCVKALKTEKVLLVACGRNHTLICTAQGKVFSSGGNSEGQLGLGDCEERTTFQRIHAFDSLGPVKMLAAGSNTSAALTESGKLFMWGDNTEGQIGLAKESHAPSPQEVDVGGPISWVSCGYYHSAFVTADGALYTFGECDSGKLGLTTEQLPRHRVPQMVKSIKEPVTQVACGGGHTVALTEERLFTFGLGQFGQLGHGTFIFESRLPRPVEHFKKGRVCQVACGENHTAVITDGGLLYTFGDGRHGKLGLGEENFTNQFKPTVCSRFLKYGVQAATCGGCHMVVLARPRDGDGGDVTLEEDDVIEYVLEKPYGEVLGCTLDSSTLNRSLSARVRRRERERSPDQFGAMFCTLPTMTPGYLHPPLSVPGHATLPRASELTHRKLPNGLERHGSTGSNLQEQAGDDPGSVVESLTDADSVKGLGETTDFLNMTHVMQLDPVEKTLTLTPVQKDLTNVLTPGDEDKAEEEEDTDGEEEEEEEEEEDTSLEVKPAGDQSPKPNQMKESEPDGEQKRDGAAEIAEQPRTTGEETGKDGSTPANGKSERSSNSQSGAGKKLSLFRRLSFNRSKQNNNTDQTSAEAAARGDASLQEEPPPVAGSGAAEKHKEGAPQQPVSPGVRGPRSGTCSVL